MSDLNSGAWGGRVVISPKFSTSGRGLKIAWFVLGCQRFIKDPDQQNGWQEYTDHLPVVAWDYLAERLATASIDTGTYVTITGRLQTFEHEHKLKGSDGVAGTLPLTGFKIALFSFNVVAHAQEITRVEPASATPTGRKDQKQEFAEEIPF